MNKNLQIVIPAILLLIVLSVLLLIKADTKSINLSLVAKGNINFPLPPYHDKNFFMIQITGENIEDEICKMLYWINQKHSESNSKCIISLDKKIPLDNESTYYACIGCTIERISYSEFSKYDISMNSEDNPQVYHSSWTEPELTFNGSRNRITVYKGNRNIVLVP